MIFVDANIFFDVVEKRGNWQDSFVILMKARLPKTSFYLSTLTVIFIHTRLFEFHNYAARDEVKELIKGFKIVPISTENLMDALDNTEINDFEDAIQYYSAKSAGCKVIITNNTKDYSSASGIEILKPKEFIDRNGSGI